MAEVGPDAEWSRLAARPPASVSGSKAWLEAAFAAAHPHATPHLLAVDAGPRLVGLLPLALHMHAAAPTLRFAGAPHNDLSDVLAAPGWEAGVAATVVRHLTALSERGWAVELENLDPDGVLAAAGPAALQWDGHEPAPVIDLTGPWRQAASGQRRRQWGRRRRRLHEGRRVEVRRLDGPAVVEALPEFVAIRAARLRATGRPLDEPPIAFLEAAVRALAPSGRCMMMDLRVDGRCVARDLYVLEHPTALMWLRALDTAWLRYSCGHLLLHATAEALAAEGYERLDLGRGDEPYKFVFGACRRVLLRAELRPQDDPDPRSP
ncbi:MAG TPA: GNAT family N-acetyltransferase [Conexibacter sp.]|nr:GNAT family N-acetyltransferase [Conexibacter sp.]